MSTQKVPQTSKTQIEILREKIHELNKEREHATLQKGLAAEENKDLRENFDYDLWEQKETMLTVRIHNLIREIESLIPKKFQVMQRKKPRKPVGPSVDLRVR
jgi:hypothetical protein